MPMTDWIDKYPQVRALLQTDGETLDYTPDGTDEPTTSGDEDAAVMWPPPPEVLEELDRVRQAIIEDESCLTPPVVPRGWRTDAATRPDDPGLETAAETWDVPATGIDLDAILRFYERAIARSMLSPDIFGA